MQRDTSPVPDLPATDLVRRMGHDFNNLFSVILGGLSLLREELADTAWNDEVDEIHADVVSAAREAAEVMARLTAWAGRQALEPRRVDLASLVQALAARLAPALPAGVALHAPYAGAPVHAWADPSALEQAVLELAWNARDAIESGGSIGIEAIAGAQPAIRVTDSGAGMSGEVLNACRQPYFTTRQGDGRRGLGLSVVDGFARACGGRLELDSAPGAGTRALLALPVARG